MPQLNTEIYEKTAKDVEAMTLQLMNLDDLIVTLKEVGTDTTEMEKKRAELFSKLEKWTAVLKRKGFLL